MDVRVEDYLNDKLQTLADFETLDTLLATLKSQQGLLQQQVRYRIFPSRSPLDRCVRRASHPATLLLKRLRVTLPSMAPWPLPPTRLARLALPIPNPATGPGPDDTHRPR